ncbi:MAG: GlsB/YeaQ/YmgE family stress response membrane protein [Candidatus Nanopelagicales bacterium]
MEFSGFFSAIFVGLIIGAVARLVVPNSQPIGCFLTMLIGIVAAAIGAAIGNAQNWSFWLIFGLQVLIGAIVVAVFSAAARGGAR